MFEPVDLNRAEKVKKKVRKFTLANFFFFFLCWACLWTCIFALAIKEERILNSF